MKIEKRVLVFIFILFGAFLNIGCHPTWYNTETKNIVYKYNTLSNTGQSAAVFGDRIYYVSQNNDQSGLYSMDLNGDDVCFEIELPKVTRIIITESCFYYVGVKGISDMHTPSAFFKYDRVHKTLEEVSAEQSTQGFFVTVADAFVLNNENTIIREWENFFSWDGVVTYCLPEEQHLCISKRFDSLNLLRFDDFIIVYNSNCDGEDINEEQNMYVLFDGTIVEGFQSTFIDIDESKYIQFHERGHFGPLGVHNERLYFANKNEVLIFDIDSLDLIKTIRFADDLDIENMFFGEKKGFLFLTKSNQPIESKQKVTGKVYSIKNCCIDFEELTNSMKTNKKGLINDEEKIEYLFDLNCDKTKIIDINEDYILYATKNKLIFWSIGLQENAREIKLKRNLLKNKIFEIAGDWLFIYDQGKEKMGSYIFDKPIDASEPNQLKYIINLKTFEVIRID